MKKMILFSIVGILLLGSCGLETYQCHSYGNTNRMTKHGNKAQAKYSKGRRM